MMRRVRSCKDSSARQRRTPHAEPHGDNRSTAAYVAALRQPNHSVSWVTHVWTAAAARGAPRPLPVRACSVWCRCCCCQQLRCQEGRAHTHAAGSATCCVTEHRRTVRALGFLYESQAGWVGTAPVKPVCAAAAARRAAPAEQDSRARMLLNWQASARNTHAVASQHAAQVSTTGIAPQ